jgi:hypothetical protein
MRRLSILLVAALAASVTPFAHGATRTRATASETRAAWVAQRARLAARLPLDPALAQAGIEFTEDDSRLIAAGDVDRDGGVDFADVRDHLVYTEDGVVETMRVEMHRGRDGKLLWSAALPEACYVFPIFTTVGDKGLPGMVVVSYTCQSRGSDAGSANAAVATVTSYDGTGATLWTQRLGRGSLWADTGYAGGWSFVDGILDANPGGGLEILAEVQVGGTVWDDNYDEVVAGARTRVVVLDGVNGVPRDIGALVASDHDDIWVSPVGDLNKDKRADVVARTTAADEVVATAFESATGTALWTYRAGGTVGSTYDVEVHPLSDTTGDGVADLALLTGGYFFAGSTSPGASASRAVLVDGATGRARWTKSGTSVEEIGNADRKKGGEVVVTNPVGGSSIGFTATAYTGSGRKVWSVTRKVSLSGLGNETMVDGGWSVIGDATADGVKEYGYGIVVQGRRTRRDEGMIDGRTGRVSRDPAHDLYAVSVAIDGRGTDAYKRTLAGGVLSVEAWRGTGATRLWRTAVSASGWILRTRAAYADKDKCGDLVVATAIGETFTDVAFSGATGKPMWGLTRTAMAAPKVTKPHVRSSHRYRKTC